MRMFKLVTAVLFVYIVWVPVFLKNVVSNEKIGGLWGKAETLKDKARFVQIVWGKIWEEINRKRREFGDV